MLKIRKLGQIEIISAAGMLFAKNGYENTPVEAIIKEAGIAKGTFYHYFKSKKDILEMKSQEKNSVLAWMLNQLMRFAPGRLIQFFINRATRRIHKAANSIALKHYV